MAITKCRECGKQVSTKAAACPNCGAKRRAPQTYGLGSLLLILLVGGGLARCFFSGEPEQPARVSAKSPGSEAPMPAPHQAVLIEAPKEPATKEASAAKDLAKSSARPIGGSYFDPNFKGPVGEWTLLWTVTPPGRDYSSALYVADPEVRSPSLMVIWERLVVDVPVNGSIRHSQITTQYEVSCQHHLRRQLQVEIVGGGEDAGATFQIVPVEPNKPMTFGLPEGRDADTDASDAAFYEYACVKLRP